MNNNSNNYMIPVAIIIAGIIVAGAVIFSPDAGSGKEAVKKDVNTQKSVRVSLENINPITKKDHVLGDPNAPVKIVEYSDFECPFCKRFDFTMHKIMDEYGKSGKVAWVYRHFPIKQLHPKNSFKVAIASECSVEQKGNIGFWEFANKYFELTISNDRTNIGVVIPKIAKEYGFNMDSFNKCLSSGKYDKHIRDDTSNAIATGGTGTPWSILIAPDGRKFPINGAQSYQTVKSLIDLVLEKYK